MLKFLLSIFFAWLLYKLVFDLIIPGYKVTKQVRRQMSDMQQHMRQQYEEQQGGQPGNSQQQAPPVQQKPADKGDYIDFEEIK
ncbi:hypothetical protein CLV51_101729 [Chitinophaga niastensis]|uniref:DUF4834 domain-containing protein n=1 Tax=Chitinophaga niastensis TaxID=536980 RepID=A0A2P8HT67_CHINA|nr:hypothetical protein [Chitinophaga niastensis]PSL49398.1 hypothetical protein CLV51_101729 [Chitinophaga niastensis]